MPGKRQHYVPRFQLRRFSVDPSDKKARIYKLEKPSGRPRFVNPENEAVIGHYYRVVTPDGVAHDEADLVLDRFENDAAGVIREIAAPDYRPSGKDIQALMLYVLTLKQRTPQAREALRDAYGQIGELEAEAILSDRDEYHRRMRVAGSSKSTEKIEEMRVSMLDDLRTGRVRLEATEAHEIGAMFLTLESSAKQLFETLGVTCLRVPPDSRAVFVTSDNPVAHYDPTPKSREAGVSFLSSPKAMTQVALDPYFALVLTQDEPQTWAEKVLSEEEVDEANTLTYAWSREAIYGPSQEAITRVRSYAKRNRQLVGQFAYRPPRIWLSRGEGGPMTGPVTFTSRYKDHTVEETFNVAPGAFKALD